MNMLSLEANDSISNDDILQRMSNGEFEPTAEESVNTLLDKIQKDRKKELPVALTLPSVHPQLHDDPRHVNEILSDNQRATKHCAYGKELWKTAEKRAGDSKQLMDKIVRGQVDVGPSLYKEYNNIDRLGVALMEDVARTSTEESNELDTMVKGAEEVVQKLLSKYRPKVASVKTSVVQIKIKSEANWSPVLKQHIDTMVTAINTLLTELTQKNQNTVVTDHFECVGQFNTTPGVQAFVQSSVQSLERLIAESK